MYVMRSVWSISEIRADSSSDRFPRVLFSIISIRAIWNFIISRSGFAFSSPWPGTIPVAIIPCMNSIWASEAKVGSGSEASAVAELVLSVAGGLISIGFVLSSGFGAFFSSRGFGVSVGVPSWDASLLMFRSRLPDSIAECTANAGTGLSASKTRFVKVQRV